MDRIGRKKALLITEVPLILGWACIALATDIRMIYAGRLLVGLGSGMVGAPARVYTSEVTQPHLRGMLSALASVGISFGILFQYTLGKHNKIYLLFIRYLNHFIGFLILGSFAPWQLLSAISALIPLLAFILMCTMPESPNYLVSRSKPEKAGRSLAKLRSSSFNINNEVEQLQSFSEKSQSNTK